MPSPMDGSLALMPWAWNFSDGPGSGRRRAEDAVDHAVGIELDVRIGSEVKKGDRLGVIHQRRANRAETRRFYDAFSWSDVSVSTPKLNRAPDLSLENRLFHQKFLKF